MANIVLIGSVTRMRNARRIARRITAVWFLGEDDDSGDPVYYNDKGICKKCDAEGIPTLNNICDGCGDWKANKAKHLEKLRGDGY